MSLVHRSDQVTSDVVALSCHECRSRYSGAQLDEILAFDELVCLDPDCRVGGMVPHRASLAEERFPEPLASNYTPLPNALMDHAQALGLGTNEMVLLWALERHRRAMGDEVWPSQRRLAELTMLSVPTVKRSITKLVKSGLLSVRSSYFKDTGRRAPNRYGLDNCWQKLADRETSSPTMAHSEPWCETAHFEAAGDQGDPPSTDQNGTSPGITVIQEEDVQRRKATAEEDLASASPAPQPAPSPPAAESAPDVAADEEAELFEKAKAYQAEHPGVTLQKAWHHVTEAAA